jgi:hypothetical protein
MYSHVNEMKYVTPVFYFYVPFDDIAARYG